MPEADFRPQADQIEVGISWRMIRRDDCSGNEKSPEGQCARVLCEGGVARLKILGRLQKGNAHGRGKIMV